MNRWLSLLLISCSFITWSAYGTTWDEPWQDKIIQESESFVLAKVKSYDEKKGVKIEIVKTLAGLELKSNIEITDFYLLDLCSYSGGHGPEFEFPGIKEAYFFIKKNSKGHYCIATPSSGFGRLKDGLVAATYRHSYHQALVPQDVYEQTMTAIFKSYHGQPYDQTYMNEYISEYLSLAPAGFSQDQLKTFFAQHVALESVYHLRLSGYYDKIIPFLNDTSNLHNQISAARALSSQQHPECKERLLKVIADTSREDFVQVMCVWSLAALKPTELKAQLITIKETASTDYNGFGGNIMDPRVCTHFPSVKDALEELIKTL